MPGGSQHERLVELIRFLSNSRWDCRVRLTVQRGAIPRSQLKARSPDHQQEFFGAGDRPELRLGRTAWLKTGVGADGATGFDVRMH